MTVVLTPALLVQTSMDLLRHLSTSLEHREANRPSAPAKTSTMERLPIDTQSHHLLGAERGIVRRLLIDIVTSQGRQLAFFALPVPGAALAAARAAW